MKKASYKKHQKAEWAVNECRKFFRSKGYSVSSVKSASANGHDLVAIDKNGNGITIEVKIAFLSSRAWKVGGLIKKHSDIVAVVFGSGEIHINSTKDHIKLCSKDGSRSMTAIGKIYNEKSKKKNASSF